MLCVGIRKQSLTRASKTWEDLGPMSVTLSQSSRWFARPLALVVAVLLTVVVATGFLGFRYWQERQAADLLFEPGRQGPQTLDRLRTVLADVECPKRGHLLHLEPPYL